MTVPAAKAPKLLSEAAVREVLRLRYPAPAWAFFAQVRNGTGYSRRTTRTADAVAMSLWPSRGLELHGFEIKTSRSDWLRELEDPEKAEAICAYCDRWWIVIGDAKIVAPGELPPTWGLLVPNGPGLLAKVEAPKLDPKPIDHMLLASILRSAAEVAVSDGQINVAVQRALEDANKRHRDEMEEATQRLREELRVVRHEVNTFEREAGIQITNRTSWSLGGSTEDVGRAVRFVLDGGMAKHRQELLALKTQAQRALAGIQQAIEVSNTTCSERSDVASNGTPTQS